MQQYNNQGASISPPPELQQFFDQKEQIFARRDELISLNFTLFKKMLRKTILVLLACAPVIILIAVLLNFYDYRLLLIAVPPCLFFNYKTVWGRIGIKQDLRELKAEFDRLCLAYKVAYQNFNGPKTNSAFDAANFAANSGSWGDSGNRWSNTNDN